MLMRDGYRVVVLDMAHYRTCRVFSTVVVVSFK